MHNPNMFSFVNELPHDLRQKFINLPRLTQIANHQVAEGIASVISSRAGKEFQDYQVHHPDIPAMDKLPTAIIAAKLRERGLEVKQDLQSNFGTGWLVRKAG